MQFIPTKDKTSILTKLKLRTNLLHSSGQLRAAAGMAAAAAAAAMAKERGDLADLSDSDHSDVDSEIDYNEVGSGTTTSVIIAPEVQHMVCRADTGCAPRNGCGNFSRHA